MAENKLNRESVLIKDLIKGVKYHFDDYSKAFGYYVETKYNEDNSVTIVFNPINAGSYTVDKGLVSFRLKPEEIAEETYYKYKSK